MMRHERRGSGQLRTTSGAILYAEMALGAYEGIIDPNDRLGSTF